MYSTSDVIFNLFGNFGSSSSWMHNMMWFILCSYDYKREYQLGLETAIIVKSYIVSIFIVKSIILFQRDQYPLIVNGNEISFVVYFMYLS